MICLVSRPSTSEKEGTKSWIDENNGVGRFLEKVQMINNLLKNNVSEELVIVGVYCAT